MRPPPPFDPDYCARVVAWGRQGWTLIEMAVALNLTRRQFAGMRNRHPEFNEAVELARELSEAFHAADIRKNAGAPNALYNARGKLAYMALLYPAWREKPQEVQVLTGDLAAVLAARRAKHLGLPADEVERGDDDGDDGFG